MSKLFIGISGKMGSGKSTLTNNIINALKSSVVKKASFAKPIYDLQNLIYNYLGLTVEGDKDRDLLIALGMWGRSKDDAFWTTQGVNRMLDIEADIVICDDVRFKNEADWFQKNGLLLRMKGAQRGDNVDVSRQNDVSETSLDDYPFEHYIDNTQTETTSSLDALFIISKELGLDKQLIGGLTKNIKEA